MQTMVAPEQEIAERFIVKPTVVVYSVPDCSRCIRLKESLTTAGIEFSEVDGSFLVDPSRNIDWRTNGSVQAVAALVHQGWNLSDMPIIRIDGEWVTAYDKSFLDIGDVRITLGSHDCQDGVCSLRK